MLLFGLLGLLEACSPVPFYFNLQQHPSQQGGMDLSGHDVALMAMFQPEHRDSSYVESIAVGFAKKMETEQYRPEGSLPVYVFPSDTTLPGETGYIPYLLPEDVSEYLVVIDDLQLGTYELTPGAYCKVSLPFTCRFLLFDQPRRNRLMEQALSDTLIWTIRVEGQVSDVRMIARAHESLPQVLEKLGAEMTSLVLPQRTNQRCWLYRLEDDHLWTRALEQALNQEWDKAAIFWMERAQNASHWQERAAAACNLSIAARIAQDYALAEAWLAWAAGQGTLPEMSILRSQLKSLQETSITAR